jgi:hypothetical protein
MIYKGGNINRSNYLTENGQILTPESYGSEVKLSGFEGTVKSVISVFNGDFGETYDVSIGKEQDVYDYRLT